MPIAFDIEKLRKEHGCVNYFETGLWDPRDDISSKQALNAKFDKVSCIEIREDWVELGKTIFKEDIASGRYNLYLDDSTNMKNYLTNDDKKTMFFLDAHVDNVNIKNYKKKCPLFEELDAIAGLQKNEHIILIDDVRYLKAQFPWGENSYGPINFLEQIMNKILSINSNYKFKSLNGVIENDVLLAYL
jgi:hypothetical protein